MLQWRHMTESCHPTLHQVTSHHRALGCLFKRLFGIASKRIQGTALLALCEGINQWILRHKGPVMRKAIPLFDVMLNVAIQLTTLIVGLEGNCHSLNGAWHSKCADDLSYETTLQLLAGVKRGRNKQITLWFCSDNNVEIRCFNTINTYMKYRAYLLISLVLLGYVLCNKIWIALIMNGVWCNITFQSKVLNVMPRPISMNTLHFWVWALGGNIQ